MYKRSWPSVIISIMLVGLVFLGIGILSLFCGYGAQSIPVILLGLAIIAGDICLFRWYQKNFLKGKRIRANLRNIIIILVLILVSVLSIGIGVYTAY